MSTWVMGKQDSKPCCFCSGGKRTLTPPNGLDRRFWRSGLSSLSFTLTRDKSLPALRAGVFRDARILAGYFPRGRHWRNASKVALVG